MPLTTTRCKPLDEWLDRHNAAMLWEHRVTGTLRVQSWKIGPHVLLVQRYGKRGHDGWGLFSEAFDATKSADVLADAEERLGLTTEVEPA